MNKKGFFVVFLITVIMAFMASTTVYAGRLGSRYEDDSDYAEYFDNMSSEGKRIYDMPFGSTSDDVQFIKALSHAKATDLNDSDKVILKMCVSDISTDKIMTALYNEYYNTAPENLASKMGNDDFGLVTIYKKNYVDDPDRAGSKEEEEIIEQNRQEVLEEGYRVQEAQKDFWGQATLWWRKTNNSDFKTPEQAQAIINTFADMINVVGTTLIIIATIILGIKYILGSVENQTTAKEGLITLLVACVFFFGWQGIYSLLTTGNDLIFTSGTYTYKEVIGNIFAVFSFVAKCVLVVSVIYVGIKYIFAGAAGKAQLKGKSVYFFVGIILAFATTNVLDFVSKIINEAVK